jgi:hypothetical protein
MDLRQVLNTTFAFQHRNLVLPARVHTRTHFMQPNGVPETGAHLSMKGMRSCAGQRQLLSGTPQKRERITHCFQQKLQRSQRFPEQKLYSLHGPKEVGNRWKIRPFDIFKQNSRPVSPVHLSMDGSHFQVRINFLLNPQNMPDSVQVLDTFQNTPGDVMLWN